MMADDTQMMYGCADDFYSFLVSRSNFSQNVENLPGAHTRMAHGRRHLRAYALLYFILFWCKLPVFGEILAKNWLNFTHSVLQDGFLLSDLLDFS